LLEECAVQRGTPVDSPRTWRTHRHCVDTDKQVLWLLSIHQARTEHPDQSWKKYFRIVQEDTKQN
jgi:hypothetical protein